MGLFSIFAILSIGVTYMVFASQTTELFDKKYESVIFGIFTVLALIIPKLFIRKKVSETVVGSGVGLGGIFTLLAMVLMHWNYMTQLFRVLLAGVMFVALLVVAHRVLDKEKAVTSTNGGSEY